jgi:hypothetical protein
MEQFPERLFMAESVDRQWCLIADIPTLLEADFNANRLFRPVLNFGLLGDFHSVIDFDIHALSNLLWPSSKCTARMFFGAARGVRAIRRQVKTDGVQPIMHNPCVLPC